MQRCEHTHLGLWRHGFCGQNEQQCKRGYKSAISGNGYQHSKVSQWTTHAVGQSCSQLSKLGEPFQYIVACVIVQKNATGLHRESSWFWDSSTAGGGAARREREPACCIVGDLGLILWAPPPPRLLLHLSRHFSSAFQPPAVVSENTFPFLFVSVALSKCGEKTQGTALSSDRQALSREPHRWQSQAWAATCLSSDALCSKTLQT